MASAMACRFYSSGFCRKGAACPYLHASSPPTTPSHSTLTRSTTPSNVIPFPSLLSPAANVQRHSGISSFPSLLSTPSNQSMPSASAPPTTSLLSPSPCPSPSPSPSPTRSPSPAYSSPLTHSSSSLVNSSSSLTHSSSSLAPSPLPFPGWDTYDFPDADASQQVRRELRRRKWKRRNGEEEEWGRVGEAESVRDDS